MVYTLVEDNMSPALDFTSQMFADHEPPSIALGITNDEFTEIFRDVMEKSVISGFSYAHETDDGTSMVLNIPYDQFVEVEYNVLSKIEPLFVLLGALRYKPTERCLYVFSIASDGKGLGSYILQHTILEARKNGFKSILADCTNSVSQHIFRKHGFLKREEITYGGFEHNGVRSFKNVINTKSVQRMELML
jgi:hypothetical protein